MSDEWHFVDIPSLRKPWTFARFSPFQRQNFYFYFYLSRFYLDASLDIIISGRSVNHNMRFECWGSFFLNRLMLMSCSFDFTSYLSKNIFNIVNQSGILPSSWQEIGIFHLKITCQNCGICIRNDFQKNTFNVTLHARSMGCYNGTIGEIKSIIERDDRGLTTPSE